MSKEKIKRTARNNSRRPGSTTCWAFFGWMDAKEKKSKGIKGHLPELAQTEKELLAKYSPLTARHLVSKVRITLLSNDARWT